MYQPSGKRYFRRNSVRRAQASQPLPRFVMDWFRHIHDPWVSYVPSGSPGLPGGGRDPPLLMPCNDD
jgi:hypothetical protein